jgi:hypothetical protein
LPWRTQALAFTELQFDNILIGFHVSPALHHFVKKLDVAKMLRRQKTDTFFNVGVFQRSVTHSRFARAARQAVSTKTSVCCVHVCNFSILTCILLAVASIYKIL